MYDNKIVDAKLKKLNLNYTKNLPDNISSIKSLWRLLKNDSWNSELFSRLYHLVHNLAGSGRLLGYTRVSEVATRLESLLHPLLEKTTMPDEREIIEIDFSFRELEAIIMNTEKENSKHFNGNLLLFFAYDIGEEIDTKLVNSKRLLDVHDAYPSSYFKNYHVPLSFSIK